jgi:hypothetical protein
MKKSLKNFYCYLKKLIRSKDDNDYWGNNPFIIL